MLLLSSSAQHIYWLGRYLFRIEYVVSHLPFTDDQQAARFCSQALCLHIDDAESLNQFMLDRQQPYSLMSQFEIARDNIQGIEGLLSSETYAELNHIIKMSYLMANYPEYRKGMLCNPENRTKYCLFFHIGQGMEQIDTCFRFQHNIHDVMLKRLIQ